MSLSEYKSLESLPCFNKNTVRSIVKKSEKTLSVAIERMLKSGYLVQLKKGLYTTEKFFESNKNDVRFGEYIATVLRYPSYLSLEYVLSKHEMLTDISYGFTSVTTKTTRDYTNKLGTFSYKKLKKDLFLGYEINQFYDANYYIASKAKALFDYLYFRKALIDSTDNVVDNLRINLSNFNTKDFNMLNNFSEKSGDLKLQKIVFSLEKYAHFGK